MSEQDKSLLDEQMTLVRAVYRALPDEEIPVEIEQRVLANAAAAIKTSTPRRWLTWSAPLASAAVVLLVVAVVIDPQSGPQMVPEPVAAVSTRQAAMQESAAPAVPRKAAEKPDVTMRAENDRAASAESRSLSASPPLPAASMAYSQPATAMPKREAGLEESVVRAQAMIAQEISEQEQGLPSPSVSTNDRPVAEELRRSGFMRSAPAAASPIAVNRANPALDMLDISPELKARLEKYLETRQKKAAVIDPDPTLDELRREYPGVDIDAALRALEQLRMEEAE